MIKISEIPFFAGLYYFEDGKLTFQKAAKKIHAIPADIPKTLSKMLRMTVQRKYLGGTMLTYKNKLIKQARQAQMLNKGPTLADEI